MSRVYHSANPNHIFTDRAEIEEHLLAKVSKNAGGKIGTELELFVTTPEGRPITFDQVELVLEHFAAKFPGATAAHEKGRIVALTIPDVGDVSLEPGGQIELSTKPCRDLAELEDMNRILRRALDETAAFLDLRVEGRGHMPSFLKAEDTPRSRFGAYREYLSGVHGKDKADALVDTMKSCCGLQVNFDPMGDDFNQIYRALMLVDVGNALSQRTVRQQRLHETYAVLVPEQMVPVFDALKSDTNETVTTHIVDRLLTLKIPFIPDHSAEGFTSTAKVFGSTPTVGELLAKGALTTEILDNALSLQLTMPNIRRHGVVETRAPDSPDSIEDLMKIATTYAKFGYDAEARAQLLQDFSAVDPQKLKAAFLSRFDDPQILSRDIGGGKTVAELVAAIGDKPAANPANVPPRRPQQGIGL